MPSVTFINETQVPLHVCLKHISPLHYTTIQPNGGKQTLNKVGSVWFTIQAKIDRGDNAYSNWDTYVPIVAVSVGALSLGAGAIYIMSASAAAGGTAAAISAVSSRIGAQAALHAPTVRKLYSYAQKGQKIVKIGQVIGIGAGATAGKVLGDNKKIEGKPSDKVVSSAEGQQVVEQEKAGGYLSSLTDWRDERKATKQAKKVLKGLLEGSVINSHGWFMNKDRTIRIVGGPRASEIQDPSGETLLIIETDTVQPFELIDASTGKKTKSEKGVISAQGGKSPEKIEGMEKTTLFDQELEDGNTREGQEKPGEDYLNSVKAEKQKERELQLQSQTADLSLESSEDEEGENSATTSHGREKSLGKTLYDSWESSRDYSLKKGSEILARFKKEDGNPKQEVKSNPEDAGGSSTDGEEDKVAPSDSIHASKDPFLNDDEILNKKPSGNPNVGDGNKGDESPLQILLEMGFERNQSEKALKESKNDTEMAIELLFNDPKNSNLDQILQQSKNNPEKVLSTSVVSTSDFKPETTTTTTSSSTLTSPETTNDVQSIQNSTDPNGKKSIKVVGGEELEKPHWTKPLTDLDQKIGASSKILKYGEDWLGKGNGTGKNTQNGKK